MQQIFTPLKIETFVKTAKGKKVIDIFNNRIKNELPFTNDNYQKCFIDKNQDVLKEIEQLVSSYEKEKKSTEKKKIENEFNKKIIKVNIENVGNKELSIANLLRTPELGGRDPLYYERRQTSELQKQLLEIKKNDGIFIVPIKLGKKIYNVYEISKHDNNVDKADIKFLDVKGRAIAWASLKKGTSPKDFQQWSGISDRTSTFISSHNETKQFISKVRELKENSQDNTQSTYTKKINDPKIKNIAIFGKDSIDNAQKKTPNNVNTIIQDEYTKMKIVKQNNYYIITGDLLIRNNTLPDSYDPTFFARPDSRRNDAGIEKTRLGIFPRDYRTGNKILEIK